MFHIELNPRGKWKEPKRFQVVSSAVVRSRISLLYLIKTNFYLYCIDVDSGEKVTNFSLKDVQDFVCSNDNGTQRILIILTPEGQIKVAWLDNDFNIAVSAKLEHKIELPIRGLEYFFDFETIVCTLKDDSESKAVIKLNSYFNNGLISKCISKFAEKLPSKFVAKLIYKCVSIECSPFFLTQWENFTAALQEILKSEGEVTKDIFLGTFKAIESLKEVKTNES